MSQSLDKMFKQIQKNSEELAIGAMMSAANKAFELAQKEAKNCLKTYLSKKPKIYRRINPSPLENAVKYFPPKLSENGSECSIVFGLRYDSTRIKGVYKSNSWWHQSGGKWISRFDNPDQFNFNSQANGIPDSGWILSNYLEGIHPGYVNGENRGWQDSAKPAETMKNFFEKELKEKAGELIYEAMQGAIIDFLNTNGGGK